VERNLGLTIIGLGVVAVVVGLLTLTGALSWFGRLPGDIHFRGERVQFYFPIVSMLVVSVVLTIAVNLLRRLF
jgi:NAD/NADP transhydrogenase beta subunit